jgi:hypothetical protein
MICFKRFISAKYDSLSAKESDNLMDTSTGNGCMNMACNAHTENLFLQRTILMPKLKSTFARHIRSRQYHK